MPSLRPALLSLLVAIPAAALAEQEGIGPFTGPEADIEAARLYRRAGDFVRNVVEPGYSYSYMQFYWKRAGSNIDRILRAYPSSPTAAQLRHGGLQLGPFAPPYFKERVLPRLEEKKVASFDAINCAIFLYNLDDNPPSPGREALLESIIRTLCRQIRWGEALAFPVLDGQRAWLWNAVIRQTAIYHNDELTEELLANIVAESKPALLATAIEGLAFRGDTAGDLEKFLAGHGDLPASVGQAPDMRLAALRGLVRREIQIERAVQLNQPLEGLYDGVDGVQMTGRRTDLTAFAATLPAGSRPAASALLARYAAGVGRWEEARRLAPADPIVAGLHLECLVLHERYADALALGARLGASERSMLLTALARAGRTAETVALREELARELGAAPACYVEFRGRMLSTDDQLTVREHTFAELPLDDPNLTGRLICEWSLTPNRTLRGATPWDAVVHKFAPGFENLPEPKDRNKVEAAGR